MDAADTGPLFLEYPEVVEKQKEDRQKDESLENLVNLFYDLNHHYYAAPFLFLNIRSLCQKRKTTNYTKYL